MNHRATRLTALLLVFLGAGFARADTWTVLVRNYEFVPNYLEICAGDTVEFVWDAGFHTTTSVDGLWDSETHRAPYAFDVTFTDAGDYFYYCALHGCPCGQGMFGLISVFDPGP